MVGQQASRECDSSVAGHHSSIWTVPAVWIRGNALLEPFDRVFDNVISGYDTSSRVGTVIELQKLVHVHGGCIPGQVKVVASKGSIRLDEIMRSPYTLGFTQDSQKITEKVLNPRRSAIDGETWTQGKGISSPYGACKEINMTTI